LSASTAPSVPARRACGDAARALPRVREAAGRGSRRKTVTIRLGDKSAKYRKGLCLKVLCGQRFGPRTHVFDAVVDKVEVKPLGDVSPRELQHDNPELRTLDEFVVFLGQLYNRDVSDEDTVTVIHFSEIRPSPA
jgi:hypothetical protein